MFDDLRGLIQRLDEVGQVTNVDGADWHLEIGTITELMVEHKKPILLFDNIKDYPEGFRIATNVFKTGIALRLGLGIPEGLSDVEVIRYWKDICEQYKPVNYLTIAQIILSLQKNRKIYLFPHSL